MSYVYLQSEPGLFTVGFYANEKWTPESDFNDREKAAERAAWLNGSTGPSPEMFEELKESKQVLGAAYLAAQKENEQLKADKAELLEALKEVLDYEKRGADKGEPRIGNGILSKIHNAIAKHTKQ